MGHADAAGKEFEDLIDAVDHLIEIGLVDREKVGITGGSYGGYASAWAATFHSERFAASLQPALDAMDGALPQGPER
jgi:dipeptidyl aminopeptidase/acylaminoacyl peptidase